MRALSLGLATLASLHSQTPPEATFPERRIRPFLGSDSGSTLATLRWDWVALASPSTLNTPLHTLSSELKRRALCALANCCLAGFTLSW